MVEHVSCCHSSSGLQCATYRHQTQTALEVEPPLHHLCSRVSRETGVSQTLSRRREKRQCCTSTGGMVVEVKCHGTLET